MYNVIPKKTWAAMSGTPVGVRQEAQILKIEQILRFETTLKVVCGAGMVNLSVLCGS